MSILVSNNKSLDEWKKSNKHGDKGKIDIDMGLREHINTCQKNTIIEKDQEEVATESKRRKKGKA